VSVTAPAGFRAAGVAAGIRAGDGPDVALVVNDGPEQVAAAVFTSNRVQAAPVLWSRKAVSDGVAHAVVLNAGGANACTGAPGFQDTHRTAEHVAEALGCSAGDVLVCSTGIIGERLPMDRLLGGVDAAVASLAPDGGPDLATMLCVITTDAVVDADVAAEALRRATRVTFDRVDSDGCMSTNDTVILLASGASGVVVGPEALTDAVTRACGRLARALVADAEGATHDIAVTVRGAISEDAAVAVARAVTRSNLFKTAVFGNDPNWGRILSAVGTVPPEVAPYEADQVDVAVNGVLVCKGGQAHEPRDRVRMADDREVHVEVDLHAGPAEATVWTNDLSHAYVHENSAYTT
jgi:glutamate N-acetyltransferase/amino-acid N-acetyltransferase